MCCVSECFDLMLLQMHLIQTLVDKILERHCLPHFVKDVKIKSCLLVCQAFKCSSVKMSSFCKSLGNVYRFLDSICFLNPLRKRKKNFREFISQFIHIPVSSSLE